MNQEELFQKVKEMIKNGNFDGAKRFIEEHKEQLGPYKEKAQNLLKDVKAKKPVACLIPTEVREKDPEL
ncbi:hypothetical protein EfmAA290_12060 [Enterococcus faecium]|nr:hypothetical protein EfmAA290_12060 [Enterococcus faecium]